MPITWRNVEAPNFTGVSDMMEKGVNSISGAIGGAHNVLEDHWNKTKQQNTDRYMNQILAAQDLESLDNIRGQLDPNRLTSEYQGQIDTRGLLTGAEDRTNQIRTNDLNRMQHDDTLMNRNSRDLRGQIEALYAAGDFVGGDRLKQEALAAGEIHGDHVADLARLRSTRTDKEFSQNIQRSNLAINQANASRQAQIHQRTMEGLDRAENSNERMMVMQDAALNYAGEYGDTEEGYQAFLAEIGGLEGLTATEKLAAGELWTKGVATYNQVPVDVQRNVDDTYDSIMQGYQEQNKINFADLDRSLEADAARFESETVRPYLTLYSEAGNQLGKIEARELIKESIDPGWLNFRSPGAVLSKVMEDIELNAREVANSIISDPRANPGLHELLANYGGRVPDSLIARAASSLKINKNGTLNTTTLKDNIRHELDTMISTMDAYDSYEQRRADRDRHKQLATQQAQDAADTLLGGYRLRTYNASRANQ